MTVLLAAVASAAVAVAAQAQTGWPQWGGPGRDFTVEARPLATSWPADGPKRIWQRPLGDGLSAIVSDGRMLFTMYRAGAEDAVVALNAATGDTIWESRYTAPFTETCSHQLGPIPRAAPLIAGQRLITVSAGGLMNSFDLRTGQRQWHVDLLGDSPDAVRACGHASSPIAFRDLIITTAGGRGRGVVALKASTGEVAWQSQDFENGYSSPLLIDLDGRPELVVFTFGDIAGLDPATGALEWSRPHPAEFGVNVATPIWGAGNLLFVSSAYNGGSRVLKLTRNGSKVDVEEIWANKRVRIHFGNAVRIGQYVYTSNGDFGAAPFAAIDITTGDMIWRDRSVVRASVLAAGGTLIILSEDGQLALATPTAEGLTVHARASLLDANAWTVPTLCGTTLYLRDRRQIMAVSLGV